MHEHRRPSLAVHACRDPLYFTACSTGVQIPHKVSRKGKVLYFEYFSSDGTDIRKPAEGGKSNRGFQLCKLTACRGKKDRVGQTRGSRISINSHADLQGSSYL